MISLVARVRGLMLSPAAEWGIIAAADRPVGAVAAGYVAPLVLLPAVAMVVGLSGVLGAPVVPVVLSALVFLVLTVAAVFFFALVLDWLAPRFGGRRSYRRAFAVAAYSITAAMVAGVLAAAPALGAVALLGGAYSLYLVFLGAPKLMATPAPASVNYAILATVSALAVGLVVGLAAMTAALAAGPAGALLPAPAAPADFTAASPNTREGAARPAAAGELREGAPASAIGGDLRDAAPETMGNLRRVSVGVERRGLPGARTVELDAEYRRGGQYIVLQIVYSKSIAETIGFGGPATMEFARETAEGYSRRQRAGQAIVTEEWNKASRTGSYGRLVQDRFYVRASGGGGTQPDDLRQAVELFGRETLAQFEAAS